ncbi:unnamed protein product [Arabidopsis halleri]
MVPVFILIWKIRDDIPVGVGVCGEIPRFLRRTPYAKKLIQFRNPNNVPGFRRYSYNPKDGAKKIGG